MTFVVYDIYFVWRLSLMMYLSVSLIGFVPVQFDSAPQRLTLRCDAHRSDWLCGVMHKAEIDLAVWCTPRSFLRKDLFVILKIIFFLDPDPHYNRCGSATLFGRAQMGLNFESWKRGKKSCDTSPLFTLKVCYEALFLFKGHRISINIEFKSKFCRCCLRDNIECRTGNFDENVVLCTNQSSVAKPKPLEPLVLRRSWSWLLVGRSRFFMAAPAPAGSFRKTKKPSLALVICKHEVSSI